MSPKDTDIRPVFACISNENGILMYAERHKDLADALLGYAQEVRLSFKELQDSLLRCTWHEFIEPPQNWQDWESDMDADAYDAMIAAASYKNLDTDAPLDEVLTRAATRARLTLYAMGTLDYWATLLGGEE